MVTVAQSAANWCNTHTHVDHTHSPTHLHQHGYNHVVRSASSAITLYRIWNQFFILDVPEGTRIGLDFHCTHSWGDISFFLCST